MFVPALIVAAAALLIAGFQALGNADRAGRTAGRASRPRSPAIASARMTLRPVKPVTRILVVL